MNKDLIKKEAKEIMDNFMSALKDIKVEEEFILQRSKCYREEAQKSDSTDDFRNRFISNAPKTSDYAVIANKGEWTK